MTPPHTSSPEADDLTERLRAELEQAHVAVEDMNERVLELVRANEELVARLKQETRLREHTERQLSEVRAQAQARQPPPPPGDDAIVRQELSVALEELQVMQEELQAAHDALSGAGPPLR